MAKLTAAARKKLKATSFALPSKRASPIHAIAHARLALAMVAAHGTSGEQAKVKRAVKARYPSIDMRKK